MSSITFSIAYSQRLLTKQLRSLTFNRIANAGISVFVAFSLFFTSTPAAAQTIVNVSKEQHANLSFWLRSSNFPASLFQALLGQENRAKAQEEQAERDIAVRSIRIDPGDVTIRVEERITLAAAAYDADGNAIGGVRMKWSVRDENRNHAVRISQNGEFESIAPGNYKVTVEGAGKKAHVKITVVDGPRRGKKEPPSSTISVSSRDVPSGASLTATKKSKRLGAHAQKAIPSRARALTAPMFLSDGWGGDNYWSSDDPGNERGNPPGTPIDNGAGSGNFEFTAPVLALRGRGIDVGLGLTYNSRMWNKAGSAINYDIDRDWPAPGFSLGFGKLLGMGVNSGCMLVDGNGTRHSYTGSISFYSWGTNGVMHTTDGSLIDYSYWTGTGGVITFAEARLPTGTVITYGANGPGGVFPTSIQDVNGNVISITYVNNSGPRIQTVTDTLGRQINFHYDGYNLLTAITTPSLGSGTRTLVRLQYRQLALSYSFSGLTPVVRDYYPWVVNAIYYPGTNNGYWFGDTDSYSTYGMLAKVSERRSMGFSAGSLNEQGTITSAGAVTKEQIYNYPLTTGSPGGSSLTDAPTYTQQTESWTRDGSVFDQAVTTYELFQNSNPRTITITLPNGSKSKQFSYNSPGSYLDGLLYQDQTLDSANNVLQSSTIDWALGSYNTARPTRIVATNERGLATATEFSYGSNYNQVTEVRNYDYGGTTLLRATRMQYQNSANYTTNRHIFNLPLVVEVFAGDGVTRVGRTEYQYDGQTLADTPDVVMHADSHNPYAPEYLVEYCAEYDYYYGGCLWWNSYWTSDYNPATDYRGNVTQITNYANAANLTGPITETRRYDIDGNMVKSSSSCCEETSYNYTPATQYAYPLSQTRGSASDAYSQVTTSATYDFNTGIAISATDANGRTSQTEVDSGTLRPLTVTLPTGAHTDFAYDDPGLSITETSYLQSHPTHTTIARQKVKLINGLGQVRQEKTLGANSVLDLVDTTFDSMGRVSQQSLPYRSGNQPLWTTTTYDPLGRVISVQAPDGSLMQAFYNEASRPNAASSLPGETRRLVDGWGRERWSRNDARGRLAEVIEPDPNGGGSVATNGMATTYAYDTQGNLTGVSQGAQSRSFKYDSVGRLIAQKLAEVSATLNDAGTYVGSGQWGEVFTYDNRSNLTTYVDARGVKTIYSYNNDPLNRLQSISWDTTGFGDTANPILPTATVTYQYRTKSSGSQLIDITQLSSAATAGVSTESFGFDSEGRIASSTLTLANRTSYPFVTDYIYDTLDRMTDVRYPAEYGNGGQPRKLVHNDFDVASRLNGLSVDGQTHASQFVYNAASQPEQLKVGASGANQITENYGYHAQTGLLASQTVVRGASTTLLNLSYDYAGANGKRTGQLAKISNNLDHNKDRGYEYDALGRLKRATGGQNVNWVQNYNYDRYGNRNNAFSHTADQYVRNFYQSALNRQPTTNELNAALAPLQSAYAQGPSQFLTAMHNLGASIFTSTEYTNRNRNDSEYVYDLYQAYLFRGPDAGGWAFWTAGVAQNGRPAVRAGFEWSLEFNLHVNGTSPYSPPGGATVPSDGWSALSYDSATNRIAVSGWNYDAAGNQTRAQNGAGWQRFQYDAANRLVKVKADDNVTVLGSYTYGATNQRLGREEANQRTYYVWSGSEVVAEYTENGGSTTPAWSKSNVFLGSRLLSTLTPNGGGGEAVQYHHADRLGTRLVTNAQDTNSFEQVTLPFGTALANESSGATNRRFTSYDRSATTSLDYAVNRHYDSQQGRFTQVDPIAMASVRLGNPQSLNLYSYCVNDPINHIDPSGLGFLSFFKKLFKIISKILSIIAIVAAVALVMTFFPGSIGAVGKFVLGMIMKITSYLGPLKFAAGAGGEVGISGVNPLGIAFSAVYAVGAVANQLQCGGKCQPKEVTGATPAQLALITDAIEDLVKRIENNKDCAKVLGGKDKALKAIRESTVKVAPIEATVILGPNGSPMYEKIYMAKTKDKIIHLGSNTVLAPDGKMTITVMGPKGTSQQTVQGPVTDINEMSATMAHEVSHRTKSKEINHEDDDPKINKENDDKVRKACGY